MIEPNMIAVMNEEEFNSLIPESVKKSAWQRYYSPEGELLRYEQRTWKEMTEDIHYIGWYGNTSQFTNATWRGKSLGDVYLVKGRMTLDNDNPLGLLDGKFGVLLSTVELDIFLEENK